WKGKRELILESSESLRRRPLAREVSEPPHQMRVEIAQSHDEGEHSSDELDEAPLGHHLLQPLIDAGDVRSVHARDDLRLLLRWLRRVRHHILDVAAAAFGA